MILAIIAPLHSSYAIPELLKSFSRFHTFIILVTTSSLGLGFGWLIAQLNA